MSDTATEVAIRATADVEPMLSGAGVAAPVMTDSEIDRTYRTAKALAASHLYNDVTSAEQGFAKLLIGRTLGLNEHQALSLYVMEGKIEVPYQMLGQFVRSRKGYDYRPGWIKESFWAQTKDGGSGRVLSKTVTQSGTAYVILTDEYEKIRCKDSAIELMTAERETVWLDEEDPADEREIVGAVIRYTVDGEVRGISRWTREDTERAGLNADRGSRGDARSNHVKYPRNMYLARAQSNGVKWLLPECIAGLPVYALGELPRADDLGAGEGGGAEPGWSDVAVAAVHEVERLIRRAEKARHAGLADRSVWQMKLRGQPDEVVARIIQEAADELTKIEAAPVATAVEEPQTSGAAKTPEEQRSGGEDHPAGPAAAPAPTSSNARPSGPDGVEERGNAGRESPDAPERPADPPTQAPDAETEDADRGETSPGGERSAYYQRSQLLEQQHEAQERGDADTVAEIQAQLDALPEAPAGDDPQPRLM